jgi:hypothetical protein
MESSGGLVAPTPIFRGRRPPHFGRLRHVPWLRCAPRRC